MSSPAPTPHAASAPADAQDVGAELERSLERRWRAYCKRLRACQKELSEPAVHQLRVATRRVMSEMVLLEDCLKSKSAAKIRRALKKRLKDLSAMRDVHVQLGFLSRNLATFPELCWLDRHLRARERKLEKAAARTIRNFGTRKLQKHIEAVCEDLQSRSQSSPGRRELLASVVASADSAHREVIARREAIRRTDLRTVHRTRVAFKRFRYIVESLSPAVTGYGTRRLGEMAAYQRKMGILQDLEVTESFLDSFLQEHPGKRNLMLAFRQDLRARRQRMLRSFLKTADAIYEFWPPPVQPPAE